MYNLITKRSLPQRPLINQNRQNNTLETYYKEQQLSNISDNTNSHLKQEVTQMEKVVRMVGFLCCYMYVHTYYILIECISHFDMYFLFLMILR
jgi:hypothetical protein